MGNRRFVSLAVIVAAFMLVGGFAFGLQSSAAQEYATPGTGSGMMNEAHPAHLHKGTCPNVAEIVYPLNDVIAPGMTPTMMGTPIAMMGTPEAGMMMASPPAGMGAVVAESTTVVKASLSDIVSQGLALNVHESLAKIQNYIACGDVTGTPSNNELTVTLNELNGSGVQGQAMLKDNGDGTTTVTVWLMAATGMASPTA